jgi:predicted acetyltransferase
MELVWPSAEYLAEYVSALERGWSPDNFRPEAGREELEQIARDPALFLARQVDREAAGPPVVLPNGSTAPRLPGYRRWIWDGEFCGVISFRWQPGTEALPPHCFGHIGYAVVPWKRGRGYATAALRMLLPEVRRERLAYVEIAADSENIPSHRVVTANGGYLVERFNKPHGYPGTVGFRFRIDLRETPDA